MKTQTHKSIRVSLQLRPSAVSFLLGGVAALVFTITTGRAAPILFAGTQSYYDLVPNNISWTAAQTAAGQLTYLGRPGRLVTITSQPENDFLRDSFSTTGAWIGGFQPLGSPEPAGGFQWITNEPFIFTSWGSGEPNNNSGDPNNPNERFIAIDDNGNWNDVNSDRNAPYIVEYVVPEPSSAALLASVGAIAAARRRRSASVLKTLTTSSLKGNNA